MQVAHRTADHFLGINVDSSQVGALDWNDTVLLKLASQFAGATFRVGGTAADLTFFNFSGASTSPPWAPDHIVQTNTTLDASVWDRLYHFAETAGLSLLFDLNAMGSRLSDNTWDSTNTEQLLTHIQSRGLEKQGVLQGFQFGNEPFLDGVKKTTHAVSGGQLADDLRTLHSLISDRNLSSALTVLQGPDEACVGSIDYLKNKVACIPDQAHFAAFVPGASSVASSLSFHFYRYSGSGGCSLAAEDLIDADKLGDYGAISDYMNVARDLGKAVPLVLSEASAVSCGGCKGISDTFVHSLWFLDFLGRAASHFALHQLYRQALFGPDAYAMVQTSAGPHGGFVAVNPDYYASLLWSRLIGPAILGVSGGSRTLRVFAACARSSPGGVTVALANWSPLPANLSLIASTSPYEGWREEYRLTSTTGSLTGRSTSLNSGPALGVHSELAPRSVRPTKGGAVVPITVEGHSIGFFVLLNASAPACFT